MRISDKYDNCTGCAVCTLSCPVWLSTRNIMLTFCGRARALQGGAGTGDIERAIKSCVLCGSCEPICSYGMNTVDRTLELLREISGLEEPATVHKGSSPRGGINFLPGGALAADSRLMALSMRLLSKVGTSPALPDNNGSAIAASILEGKYPGTAPIEAFLSAINTHEEAIVEEGLLKRLIMKYLPNVRVTGLGEAILNLPGAMERLGPGDLYIIESRGYHAEFKRLVDYYDNVRRRTGCMMNVDLHRVATPTGARADGSKPLSVDTLAQAKWIMQGRPAKRVIVEKLEDKAAMQQATDAPVIHVLELMQ